MKKDSIAAYLADSRTADIHVFDSVDSTHAVLKGLAAAGAPDGTIVLADAQTAGKGRRGRTFVSPPGAGVYLSCLLRPASGLGQVSALTAWTAVAVADAIQAACGLQPRIKWVNDLVLNGRKVCGILAEAVAARPGGPVDACLIGIGVNVHEVPGGFPPELADVATSLAAESRGAPVSRHRLAGGIIRAMDALRAAWPDDPRYLRRYRELNATVGAPVTVFPQMRECGGGREGTALAVNDDFSLKVAFADGTSENIQSGEVAVRGLCGCI